MTCLHKGPPEDYGEEVAGEEPENGEVEGDFTEGDEEVEEEWHVGEEE